MTTGYEVRMYTDIARIANALEKLVEQVGWLRKSVDGVRITDPDEDWSEPPATDKE